ncbi:RNase A-like domain-containing protein, partial [Enterobacter cloacae]|uniref:RNase A-like domain-containing protein n=1 Tax=Enterobacter cloacae TaxID=550 RepID=UPI0039C156C8
PEGIPAAADIVNLRYKSCSEMEGQDQSSTFKNLNVAESVISRAIYYKRANIKSLLGGGNRGGRLTIVYPAGQEIGYGFSRGSTQRISMRSVRIVIELKEYNGKPYYILTAFPTP